MKRIMLLAVTVMFLLAVPCAKADFSVTPTFDLTTSSNLAGATDAVYTLRAENNDSSEDASLVVILIPAGYSIGPSFVTDKGGVRAFSMYGKCPEGTGRAGIMTTKTPSQFSGTWGGRADVRITIVAPDVTAQGKMEIEFPSGYSFVNRNCNGELTTEKGFFINPQTPGSYVWGPSIAQPIKGSAVEMVPRSGFTQTIQIIGPSLTTQTATSTTISATAPTTTVLTPTSQTTLLPATTTPVSMTESETTTTQPAPTSGGFPTEILAVVAIVLVVLVAVAFYALKRRK